MSRVDLKDILNTVTVVEQALNKNAKDKDVSLQKKDVPVVANDVTKAVNDNVATAQKEVDAVIENATNSEPWYQSRVTWGAIVSILFPLLTMVGVKMDWIDQSTAVNGGLALGAAVGAVVTLYGRWVAAKPIGK